MEKNTLIPNRPYAGKKEASKIGKSHFCQERNQYSMEWSAVLENIEVDIPKPTLKERLFYSVEKSLEKPAFRKFSIDFELSNLRFKGRSLSTNAWTCESPRYEAELHSQSATLSFKIIPDPKRQKSARFELSRLELSQLDVKKLRMRRFGINLGFSQMSPYWDLRSETYFNLFSGWLVKSAISHLINETISREVSEIVKKVFGMPSVSLTASVDEDIIRSQLQGLDKVDIVD